MKNILILADGNVAKNFIEWVSKKRIAQNQYYVTCHKSDACSDKVEKNITMLHSDPTSYSKLTNILNRTKFSNLFIIMEDKEEVHYVLKNLSLLNTKIRIVLLNQWDDNEIGKEMENMTIIHKDSLLAGHLYDQLPNVPLVAQNVGLGRGEIMEVHVPFGSSYAYRHIGSIVQRKWKIAALYRDEKQILPNNATRIQPNDTLLLLGKPLVLDGIYKAINKRMGLFPEPFGKNLYLLIDCRHDNAHAITFVEEALYMLEKLEEKSLLIRVIYPNDFALLDQLKSYESHHVNITIHYETVEIKELIEYDIHEYNIGLILNSIPTFEADNLKETFYHLKKLVYLFGTKPLHACQTSVILMNEHEKMESISSTAFDITETLGLGLTLSDFDPEGDFESKKTIIEHYETLTHIFNIEINIEQKVANPIRELTKKEHILHIAPFEEQLNTMNLKRLISSKIKDFILTIEKHPKLLVPFAITEA